MLQVKNKRYKAIDDKIRKSKIQLILLKDKIRKHKGLKERSLSEESLNFLIENYGEIPNKEIAEKIGRKVTTINYIAKDLLLSNIYIDDDEMLLYQFWIALTGTYCDSYQQYLAKKWGLPLRKERNWQIISLNKFFKWYKNHIKLINCWHYNKGDFPIEPDWFLEKVEADKRADAYMYKRLWTNEEDKRLLDLVNQGKGYKEISFALKRTGNSIKRRCYDLGYPKPKKQPPKLWTETEMEKLKELWLKGYQPCIIAEELDKSDRQVTSMLERYNYYDTPPQKFSSNFEL